MKPAANRLAKVSGTLQVHAVKHRHALPHGLNNLKLILIVILRVMKSWSLLGLAHDDLHNVARRFGNQVADPEEDGNEDSQVAPPITQKTTITLEDIQEKNTSRVTSKENVELEDESLKRAFAKPC